MYISLYLFVIKTLSLELDLILTFLVSSSNQYVTLVTPE